MADSTASASARQGAEPEPKPPPSLRGATVRGVRLAGIGYAASTGLTFVAYLVLVRLISPHGFGLFAAGTIITGVGGLFAESGMLAALINRKDRLDEAASTAFFALCISGCLLTLGSLAISPLIGLLYHSSEVTLVTAVMSGWLLVRAMTIVPDALLQRRFSFARRVVVDPLGVFAFAAVGIPLAAAKTGVWALCAGSYASIVLEAVSAWWFVRFRPRLRQASFSLWREMASFTRLLIVGEVLRRIALQMDALTLGVVGGTASLGQYRNGLRLAQQPAWAFGAVIAYVLLPAFARIGHLPQRISAAARHVFWVSMTFTVPISFASLPLGVPLAVILLGARWRPAGHVIAGLSGLALGYTIMSIAGELLKSLGRTGVLFGVQVVWFGLVLVTVTTTAIIWGLVGVAIAMSFSACVAGVYSLVRSARALNIGLRQLIGGFDRPLFATAVMVPAMLLFADQVKLLDHRELIRLALLIAEVLVGVLSYGVVLAAIDPARRRWAQSIALQFLRSRRSARPGVATSEQVPVADAVQTGTGGQDAEAPGLTKVISQAGRVRYGGRVRHPSRSGALVSPDLDTGPMDTLSQDWVLLESRRTVPRPRHRVPRIVLFALWPLFRYSDQRDAWILRGIGENHGPVLQRIGANASGNGFLPAAEPTDADVHRGEQLPHSWSRSRDEPPR